MRWVGPFTAGMARVAGGMVDAMFGPVRRPRGDLRSDAAVLAADAAKVWAEWSVEREVEWYEKHPNGEWPEGRRHRHGQEMTDYGPGLVSDPMG